MKGYNRGVNKGFAWRILHSVEDQACGARGKVTNFFWIQVKFTEGPIIFSTAGAESTMLGISYLSKYPDQCSNVSIGLVSRQLLMSKFFGLVNEVDLHNNSRQSDLALEKFWVTQYSWLRLCTTVAMGTTISNCWKLFRYGVKREHSTSLSASGNLRKESRLIASIILSQ